MCEWARRDSNPGLFNSSRRAVATDATMHNRLYASASYLPYIDSNGLCAYTSIAWATRHQSLDPPLLLRPSFGTASVYLTIPHASAVCACLLRTGPSATKHLVDAIPGDEWSRLNFALQQGEGDEVSELN